MATDSGSPTPRCNRRRGRGVQDQADFSESLCHLSSSSPPGSRLNAIRWAAIRSVALLGRTCSRFCVVPEALFLTTTIAHAVQTLAVYTVATCEVFDKTKNRASAERDSARSCCRSPIGTTLISCIGQSTVQRQDTGAVVEPVTPQTNTKRRVRVRIRYFTYRSSAKKEIRAQNGKIKRRARSLSLAFTLVSHRQSVKLS